MGHSHIRAGQRGIRSLGTVTRSLSHHLGKHHCDQCPRQPIPRCQDMWSQPWLQGFPHCAGPRASMLPECKSHWRRGRVEPSPCPHHRLMCTWKDRCPPPASPLPPSLTPPCPGRLETSSSGTRTEEPTAHKAWHLCCPGSSPWPTRRPSFQSPTGELCPGLAVSLDPLGDDQEHSLRPLSSHLQGVWAVSATRPSAIHAPPLACPPAPSPSDEPPTQVHFHSSLRANQISLQASC